MALRAARRYHGGMIGSEDIARYRAMSMEERFEIFHRLMNFAWESLLELPDEERRRRLAWLEHERDAANARLEAKFRELP